MFHSDYALKHKTVNGADEHFLMFLRQDTAVKNQNRPRPAVVWQAPKYTASIATREQ